MYGDALLRPQIANVRIFYVSPGQNIQFAPQQQPISVSVAQTIPTSQIIVQSQPQMMPTTIPTPEPMRNPTPITLIPQVQFDHTPYRDRTTFHSNAGPLTHTNAMQNTTVIVPEPPKSQVLSQPIIQPPHTSTIPPNELVKQPASTPMSSAIAGAPIAKPAKKPKKSKAKKEPHQAMTMVSVSQPQDMLPSHSAPKVNIAG